MLMICLLYFLILSLGQDGSVWIGASFDGLSEGLSIRVITPPDFFFQLTGLYAYYKKGANEVEEISSIGGRVGMFLAERDKGIPFVGIGLGGGKDRANPPKSHSGVLIFFGISLNVGEILTGTVPKELARKLKAIHTEFEIGTVYVSDKERDIRLTKLLMPKIGWGIFMRW